MLFRRLWITSTNLLHFAPPTRALELPPELNLFPNTPIQQAIRLSSTLSANMTRGAVISLAHGGGPLPVLGDPSHKALAQSLKTRVPEILHLNTPEAPRAIILVTAHWSERNPTISNGEKHKLYYDYGGFPPESYKLKYDAPGSPSIAKDVHQALSNAGLKPENDEERGESLPAS
jgi:aromatic ring-opening dioxygenase catalytic subunit (LigB family)